MPLAAYALFHMVAIFPLGHIKLFAELPVSGLLLMQMADGFLAVFTCILSDPLADRFGRRLFLIVVTAVIGILSFFIIGLLDRAWVFVLFDFGLLGLSFGQSDGTRPDDLARTRFRGLLPDVGRGRDADRSLHPPAHVQ